MRALASQLPSYSIPLMCDPDAMKAQLIANGTAQGTCYEIGVRAAGNQRDGRRVLAAPA